MLYSILLVFITSSSKFVRDLKISSLPHYVITTTAFVSCEWMELALLPYHNTCKLTSLKGVKKRTLI